MAQTKKGGKALKIISTIFFVLVLAFCAITIFFNVTHEYFEVKGPSMTPTINAGVENEEQIKDGVFVSKISGYSRGDIIVTNRDYGVDNSPHYVIKRVIAIGGDKIKIQEIDGVNRIVLIKAGKSEEEVLDEPYLESYETNSALKGKFDVMINERGLSLDENGFLEIVQSEVFYLGDNRLKSKDCSNYGPQNKNAIVGKVDFIIYGNSNRYGQVIGQVFGW